MEKPNVITKLKIGYFTLQIQAYRKLNKAEANQALAVYMKENRLKAIPKKGIGTVVSIHGFIDQ
jgi:hypothetical protein